MMEQLRFYFATLAMIDMISFLAFTSIPIKGSSKTTKSLDPRKAQAKDSFRLLPYDILKYFLSLKS